MDVSLVFFTAFAIYVTAMVLLGGFAITESYTDGEFKAEAAARIAEAIRGRADEYAVLPFQKREFVDATLERLDQERSIDPDVGGRNIAQAASLIIARKKENAEDIARGIIDARRAIQERALDQISAEISEPLKLMDLRRRLARSYSAALWILRRRALADWGMQALSTVGAALVKYTGIGALLGTALLVAVWLIFVIAIGGRRFSELGVDVFALGSNAGFIAATVSFAIGLFFAIAAPPLRALRDAGGERDRRYIRFVLISFPAILLTGAVQMSYDLSTRWYEVSFPATQAFIESEPGTRIGVAAIGVLVLGLVASVTATAVAGFRAPLVQRSSAIAYLAMSAFIVPVFLIFAAFAFYLTVRPELLHSHPRESPLPSALISGIALGMVGTWMIATVLLVAAVVVRAMERRQKFKFYRSLGLSTKYVLHPFFAVAACWVPIIALYLPLSATDGSWLLAQNPRPPSLGEGTLFLLSMLAGVAAPIASIIVAIVQMLRRSSQNERLAGEAHFRQLATEVSRRDANQADGLGSG